MNEVMNAPSGVIIGQMEYVWAAYLIYWLFLGGYAVSLWLRHREER